MKTYAVLPVTDVCGNAGSMSPGEREQRYRPFMEKKYEKQSKEGE